MADAIIAGQSKSQEEIIESDVEEEFIEVDSDE